MIWQDETEPQRAILLDQDARLAAPPKVGGEVIVDGGAPGRQDGGTIAVLDNGNILVTWSHSGDAYDGVHAQLYNAAGGVAGTGFVMVPVRDQPISGLRVVALEGGRFVAMWAEDTDDEDQGLDVNGQLFSAAGVPIGDVFSVTTRTEDDERDFVITALEGGGFAVAFVTGPGYSTTSAAIFDNDGEMTKADFGVGGSSFFSAYAPQVVALDNGGFAMSWLDQLSGLRFARFDANGTRIGTEVQLGRDIDNRPDVEMALLADGAVAVAWQENTGDRKEGSIGLAVVDANGARIGTYQQVNTAIEGSQTDHRIAALSGGGFVITWTDMSLGVGGATGDASEGAIKAQLFASDGAKVGGEMLVNTTVTGHQSSALVVALANGGFVVVWEDWSAASGSPDIRGQAFDASGSRMDAEFLVNTTTAGTQQLSDLRALSGGGFVVSWSHSPGGGATADGSVRMQVFGAPAAGPIIGTPGDDTLNGTAGADVIQGLAGADMIDGKAGADRMEGGAGNDTYVVDNAGDLVVELAGEGDDRVNASVSHQLAANVERLSLTGTAAINGVGNELANVIAGNSGNNILKGLAGNDVLSGGAGNDTLDGGTGADRMTGGAGNDTYFVDNAGDVVIEAAGGGTDRVNTTVTWSAAGQDIENIAITGTGRINVVGNDLNNVMTGNDDVNALNGGRGADRMVGGGGNDLYYVDNVGDVVVEAAGGGTDTVRSAVTYTLGANVERLQLVGSQQVNAIGNALDNVLQGNARSNVIIGMGGRDLMTGGGGADRFDFRAVSDSPFAAYDRITDLEDQDVINLSAIDANTNIAGDQGFTLVAAFTRQAGQLTLSYVASGDFTVLAADVNGDGVGDFRVILNGDHTDYDNFRL